jgi:uncharacterized SAM-binding protein YcdF (DUF218 family)
VRGKKGPSGQPSMVRSSRTVFVTVLAIVCMAGLAAFFFLWIPRVGHNLACEDLPRPGDAILVENFDPSYLVFERAGELQKAGLAPRIVVPTTAGSGPGGLNGVAAGFVDVLARAARLEVAPEMIPIEEIEPISLNAAYQVRAALQKAGIRSVIVVAPGFRSRRSLLVYGTVFGAAGIETSCVPVFGQETQDNWRTTWHGIQQVVEQYGKLQYYRFYVLPRARHETS